MEDLGATIQLQLPVGTPCVQGAQWVDRRHPLPLSNHSDAANSTDPSIGGSSQIPVIAAGCQMYVTADVHFGTMNTAIP